MLRKLCSVEFSLQMILYYARGENDYAPRRFGQNGNHGGRKLERATVYVTTHSRHNNKFIYSKYKNIVGIVNNNIILSEKWSILSFFLVLFPQSTHKYSMHVVHGP